MCLPLNEAGLMLFGVFDGHGGPRCAQYLSKRIPEELKKIKDIRHDHEIASMFCNIDRDFIQNENLYDDGSTACVVLGQWWDKSRSIPLQDLPSDYSASKYPSIVMKLLAINVGDSRATIILPECNEYIALTKDHKPNDPLELQRIHDAGGQVSSNRVDGNLALSRAFGDKTYKQNELLPFNEQKVTCAPDFTTHYLTPGSMLVVCCDGLFEADCMDYKKFTQVVKESVNYYSHLSPPFLQNIPSYLQFRTQYQQYQQSLSKFSSNSSSGDVNKLLEQFDIFNQANWKKIQNFDPAGIGRDLIAKSIEYGSRDNHTAVVVHFLPEKFEPIHPDGYEFIPGPCHALQPDTTFLRCYRNDISTVSLFQQAQGGVLTPASTSTTSTAPLSSTTTPHYAPPPRSALQELHKNQMINSHTILSSLIGKISSIDNDYLAYCHWFESISQHIYKLRVEKDQWETKQHQEALIAQQQAATLAAQNNSNISTPATGSSSSSTASTTSSQSSTSRSSLPNTSTTSLSSTSSDPRADHLDIDPVFKQTEMITTQQTFGHPISSQSQLIANFHQFDDSVINLYYPLPYMGQYTQTQTSLMPIYYPNSQSQFPEWLDACIQHSLSHGDDCDSFQ